MMNVSQARPSQLCAQLRAPWIASSKPFRQSPCADLARCRSTRDTQTSKEAVNTADLPQTEADGPTRLRPNPEQLRLQKVERLGKDVWAGVAAVDREEKDTGTSLRKAALLAGGDLTALLLFAAAGRRGHGESLDLISVLKTAAPFLIADLQKAFGREAQGGNVAIAAKKAALVWATGIPVGIGVRTAQRGYLPDISFVIVTLAVTLPLLVGWRSCLAVVSSKGLKAESPAARRKNKQGNPLEFLQLLASLTKRW